VTDADPTSNPPPSNQIEWQDALWLLGMGVVFSMFYLSIAQDYRMFAGYTKYDNVLFGADHVDALNGWIGKHKGTHPLLPLVVVPLSNLFGSICGDYESGLSLLSGCIGGFAVAMFYGLLRMVVQRPASVAGTLLFGFSMNQMVFSGLPDTYVLVAISIIPSFMLLLRSLNTGQLNSVLWTAAGVLAFSITITTLAQFAVCLTAALLATQGVRLRSLTQGIGICICAIGIGTALVAVQYSFYPDSQLFFQPAVYNYEMQYLTPLIVEHPGAVTDELIKSFWLFNIVGQDPLVVRHEPGLRVELIYYRAAVDYGWLEMAAVVPWLVLYIRGAIRTLQDSARRPFLLATWVCVGSHLTLHSFFSTDELFLYAPHYTFIVLLTAISPSSTKGRLPLCGWLAVATRRGVVAKRVAHPRAARTCHSGHRTFGLRATRLCSRRQSLRCVGSRRHRSAWSAHNPIPAAGELVLRTIVATTGKCIAAVPILWSAHSRLAPTSGHPLFDPQSGSRDRDPHGHRDTGVLNTQPASQGSHHRVRWNRPGCDSPTPGHQRAGRRAQDQECRARASSRRSNPAVTGSDDSSERVTEHSAAGSKYTTRFVADLHPRIGSCWRLDDCVEMLQQQ